MTPKANIIDLRRHQMTSNSSRKSPNHFQRLLLEISSFGKSFLNKIKGGTEKSGRSVKVLNISDMGSISIKSWKWICESLKLWDFRNWNFDKRKLRNFETWKLRNFETFDFQLRDSPHPWTFRFPPLHQPAPLHNVSASTLGSYAWPQRPQVGSKFMK